MTPDIEAMQKDLKQFAGGPYHPPMWKAMSIHVTKLILMARIELIQEIKSRYHPQIDYTTEIVLERLKIDLTNQLKEVNDG